MAREGIECGCYNRVGRPSAKHLAHHVTDPNNVANCGNSPAGALAMARWSSAKHDAGIIVFSNDVVKEPRIGIAAKDN